MNIHEKDAETRTPVFAVPKTQDDPTAQQAVSQQAGTVPGPGAEGADMEKPSTQKESMNSTVVVPTLFSTCSSLPEKGIEKDLTLSKNATSASDAPKAPIPQAEVLPDPAAEDATAKNGSIQKEDMQPTAVGSPLFLGHSFAEKVAVEKGTAPKAPDPQNEAAQGPGSDGNERAATEKASTKKDSTYPTTVGKSLYLGGSPAEKADTEKTGTQKENTRPFAAKDQPFFACAAEKWAVPGCLLLGWCYYHMMSHSWVGTTNSPPLWFTLLFCAAVVAFYLAAAAQATAPTAGAPALSTLGEGPIWLGCSVLASLALVLGRCNAVPGPLVVLLWHLCAGYGVLAAGGQLCGGASGGLCLLDGLRGIGWGFAGLLVWPRAVWVLLAQRRRRAVRVATLLCVAGALGLLALAAAWLGQADSGFAQLLATLAFWRGWRLDADWLLTLFCAALVGAFFYGLVVAGAAAARQHPRPQPDVWRQRLQGLRTLSCRLVCGLLGAFVVLYLLFFAVQGRYLFGGLLGRLPAGFTVAQYARQGFFELCRVMLLNLGLLGAAELLAQQGLRAHRPLRRAAAALLGESLLLWLTAAAKLGLYMLTFGFTPKRLLAAWALLVLAVAAVRALQDLRRPCAIVRPTVLVGAVSLAALCLY